VPAITPREAKNAVAVLERLQLVKLGAHGVYRVTDKLVRPGPEVQRIAIRGFHAEAARLATQAIEKQPVNRRSITGLTLGISHETYLRVCEETERFQSRLLALAEADPSADEVYQYNFQIFPMSNPKVKERTL
jgi:uncharacterized protein (TIGR02147 family)